MGDRTLIQGAAAYYEKHVNPNLHKFPAFLLQYCSKPMPARASSAISPYQPWSRPRVPHLDWSMSGPVPE